MLASFVGRTKLLTLSPVSAGMGDRLRAGIPPRYVTKPTRLTQPCIPLGLLNRVPALIGWGKGGNATSAGWQVILCDPIWHGNCSCSGAVLVAQTAIRFHTLPYLTRRSTIWLRNISLIAATVRRHQRRSSDNFKFATISTNSRLGDGAFPAAGPRHCF